MFVASCRNRLVVFQRWSSKQTRHGWSNKRFHFCCKWRIEKNNQKRLFGNGTITLFDKTKITYSKRFMWLYPRSQKKNMVVHKRNFQTMYDVVYESMVDCDVIIKFLIRICMVDLVMKFLTKLLWLSNEQSIVLQNQALQVC